jgi:hypothetical protein
MQNPVKARLSFPSTLVFADSKPLPKVENLFEIVSVDNQ